MPEVSQRAPAVKATLGELQTWWTDLAEADASKAHTAIWKLAAVTRQAVPFLRERLHPASAVAENRLQELLADLDSNQAQRREAAWKHLAELEEQAEPALRQAQNAVPSAEQRRRIETILEGPMLVRSPEKLRHIRAIEVLELSDLLEARQILEKLAQGAPDARLTQEAKASLERLAKQPAAP
jgi:hypothetical protein